MKKFGGIRPGGFLIISLLVLFIGPLIWEAVAGNNQADTVSYSEFRRQLENGNIGAVTVQGDKIQGTFLRPHTNVSDGRQIDTFSTWIPPFDDPTLMETLRSKNVQIQSKPVGNGSIFTLLIGLLPFMLLLWIGFSLMKNIKSQGNNVFSMGKSKARRYTKTRERTTFDDVAGTEGAKNEVMEIVDFLKNPDKYHRLGAKTPTGVLLVGPPGTGKTLLARAIAGEADVPFYSISGSDFMEMFVGVGASRVRDLFTEAKKNQPSIIFIDELDSIGRKRGTGLGGGNDEREQTLNQLLSELDGFEQNKTTIIIAATNRPDILDSALLRPGRFDRRVTVDFPTMTDREQILAIHARKKPLSEGVDLTHVARSTPGWSGADLENLLNEAALLAARKNKNAVDEHDIDEARDKVLMGLERKSLTLTQNDKRLVAYHEAGHAVLAVVLPETDTVHKVTIIPRDQSMGVTQQLPDQDRYIYRKEYLFEMITVMYGGRAAEELIYGSVTSGAENDLKQATRLARKMIISWGMSEKYSHISFGEDQENVFLGDEIIRRKEFSESTARIIDEEISGLLSRAYAHARKLLTEYSDALHEVAKNLLQHEELPGTTVKAIVESSRKTLTA